MPSIAVDLDNTICDTMGVLRRWLKPPWIADHELDWTRYGATPAFWEKYGHDVSAVAEPYPGAAGVLHEIQRSHGLVYISARPGSEADVTVEWLRRHGFPGAPVLLGAETKDALARECGCTLAIDDDPRHIAAYRQAGLGILVPKRPYNLGVAGSDLFEEWYEVLIRAPAALRTAAKGV